MIKQKQNQIGLCFPEKSIQVYVAASENFQCGKSLFIIIVVILIDRVNINLIVKTWFMLCSNSAKYAY